jgi:hypothetical protein
MRKSLLIITFTLHTALAQGTVQSVVPFGLENQSGNGNDTLFATPGQTQQLFRSTYLASQWQTPVEITGMAFRVAAGSARSLQVTIPRVEIRFSTSSRTPENMSTIYVVNKGPNETTVFLHDNVSLSGATGQSVNPFDIRLSFDRPFVYDPVAGNLLMSITLTGGFLGGAQIDAQGYTSLAASPAGYVTPHTGDQVGALAEVTEFSFVPIPEPPVSYLFVAGSFLIIMNLRRR